MPLELGVNLARCRWLVRGQVQGVGFRPFVYRTASKLRLSGFVRNDSHGVVIECQGDPFALREFERTLHEEHPASAVIRAVERQLVPSLSDDAPFHILNSETCAHTGTDVMVDTATCPDCVREILAPDQRRRGYALTNCTQCGPRFSIIRRVPYDRCNTTMAGFEMCPSCNLEFKNPTDRRFHAQPIACHDCGPQVELVDPQGRKIAGDPIAVCRQMLLNGKIVAIKGLGGFHLAVRADDDAAVLRLRGRKHRDHKPFAIMVGSIQQMRQCVDMSAPAERAALSPACPIVLAKPRRVTQIAPAVAPACHRLGVMLPYTSIHHLLFNSDKTPPALVMTSGNQSDEPIAIENREALERLGGICDAILWHDRPIQRGVDDSVIIDIGEHAPIPLRRARGYAPGAIALPVACNRPGLCVGAELKNTIAVVRDGSAILSHHLGDLTNVLAFSGFRKAIADFRDLFSVEPRWIAHDLHPMYLSTAHAKRLAESLDVPLIPVQHHHAHAASVMAEHGLHDTILAVVCDGTGFGPDGTIWGGELLAADLLSFRRLARLRPIRLAGGDAAARDTTRCALGLLHQTFGDAFIEQEAARRMIPDGRIRAVLGRMIQNNFNCATSSGAGRLFDGVAALLGICRENRFEAQAAMALESAASRCDRRDSAGVPRDWFEIHHNEEFDEIDFSPLVCELVRCSAESESADVLASLFHEQFARAWARVVVAASRQLSLDTVALSGGVFCNAIVTTRLTELLESNGLRVLRNTIVPPNDGGIALGQAAIAAARLMGG